MAQLTFSEALGVLISLRDGTSAEATDEYSRFTRFCLENVARSRAQFLQDLWVAYELKSLRGGFFVEFGAADGLRASNSWFLEHELGWKGVLAEPARVWLPALRANRRCGVDARCVWSESSRRLVFNESVQVPLHSTLEAFTESDAHGASRRDGTRYEVETVSLNDLLAHWKAPRRIDYLSIDTEGSELDILQAFDFGAWDVRLITVEHNFTDRREAILDLLASKGFRRKFQAVSNVDDWYVRVQ
jgi:FkbM family methyltransferase